MTFPVSRQFAREQPDEPTYIDPGDCPMCGACGTRPSLVFEGTIVNQLIPEMVGELWAVCARCGYRWTVKTKDEMHGKEEEARTD